MSKQYRKPASKPRGFSPSCINERRWDRTVSRVIDGRSEDKRKSSPKYGFEESSTGVDNLLNPIKQIYPRRQENLITKFERSIPAQKVGNVTSNKMTVTQTITEDFIGNSLDAWERKFDTSNRLVCFDLVTALNPKKANKISPRVIALHEKDYADSMEWYNLCRNCQQPIKTRKATFDDCIKFSEDEPTLTEEKSALLDRLSQYASDLKEPIDASHRVRLYGAIEVAKRKLAELYKDGIHEVAEIPAHWEVKFISDLDSCRCKDKSTCKCTDFKRAKAVEVPRKLVFNQKCSCMFVEVRKQERTAERKTRKDITL